MMNITDPAINSYLRKLTPASHPVLLEMEQYAAKHGFPIIGPLTGRMLQQLVILTGAKRIFEMGSGYGYSAISMALVMRPGGTIECTETDEENIARGRKHAQCLSHWTRPIRPLAGAGPFAFVAGNATHRVLDETAGQAFDAKSITFVPRFLLHEG